MTAEARTPLERIAALLPLNNGPRDEDVVEIRAGDLGILYAIAIETECVFASIEDKDTEVLCILFSNLYGQDDHDWGDWEIPYTNGDEWFRSRMCQRCYDTDTVPVNLEQCPDCGAFAGYSTLQRDNHYSMECADCGYSWFMTITPHERTVSHDRD